MNSTAEFSTGTKSSLRAPRSLVSSFSTPPQVDAKTFNSFVFLEDLVRASGPQEGHAADIFSRSSSSTVTMMMHSIDASKPTDLLDQPGMEEMLTPAFDLVRKYIAEYTSQEEADEVSDADILAVFMPSKNEDEDNDRSLVLKGSQQERSLTTNTACLGDMIDVITEAIAMIMVLFGLASVARPIGRALAKSLKSRSLKAIWEIVQRLGKNKGAGELAEAVAVGSLRPIVVFVSLQYFLIIAL